VEMTRRTLKPLKAFPLEHLFSHPKLSKGL
jgi:hypothetical protein